MTFLTRFGNLWRLRNGVDYWPLAFRAEIWRKRTWCWKRPEVTECFARLNLFSSTRNTFLECHPSLIYSQVSGSLRAIKLFNQRDILVILIGRRNWKPFITLYNHPQVFTTFIHFHCILISFNFTNWKFLTFDFDLKSFLKPQVRQILINNLSCLLVCKK